MVQINYIPASIQINGLAPSRRQAIIWIIDGFMCHSASVNQIHNIVHQHMDVKWGFSD